LKTEQPGLLLFNGKSLLVLLLALLARTLVLAGELPAATDLRNEAEQARRQGGPLIILFSRRDCRYCATVRNNYLIPLAASPDYGRRVVVRQVDQESSAALIDFHGQPTSHAAFAASEKIKLVPVVAFFDASGQQLAAPIVGLRLADFYQSYLEEAINQSIKKLSLH